MSIIEAMAMGVPVVATRVGAVPDLISNGSNGLLVDAASPSAIADAVGLLFDSPSLRNSISHAAHNMVNAKYSYEVICSAIMRIYEDLLTKAPLSPEAKGLSKDAAAA
jgi:glycosyltransferase involved in cell wall biosynthesis